MRFVRTGTRPKLETVQAFITGNTLYVRRGGIQTWDNHDWSALNHIYGWLEVGEDVDIQSRYVDATEVFYEGDQLTIIF